MDLVPKECPSVERWVPAAFPKSDEGDFLSVVGDAFMKVGDLDHGALGALEKTLATCPFLTQAKPPAPSEADAVAVEPARAAHDDAE